MADEQSSSEVKTGLDILVGIEAGVLGGLLMLLWFALITPLTGQPWWLIPNLIASKVYGQRADLLGPGMPTVFGAALQVVTAGLVGGNRLFGLFVACGWYLLCYLFIWKRVSPGLIPHAPAPVLMAGYFIYGSVLGWHPHLVRYSRTT
jgi:hypothetical protein